jgi:putative tricarboxylic transport membrane protein
LVLVAAVVMGIVFGALPGLTATLGIALLTTATSTLELPLETTMVALMGVYVGAIYGGCHPAVLLNIPGTAAGAATALEGHPLCKQGRGGEAIATATIMSFAGTVFGEHCNAGAGACLEFVGLEVSVDGEFPARAVRSAHLWLSHGARYTD